MRINNALKIFLLGIILILPFQNLPRTFVADSSNPVIQFIAYIDEITFLFAVVLVISFILLKPKVFRLQKTPFSKYILLYILVMLGSLLINKVPFWQGGFGIYDVLKNIFVFYVFVQLDFSKEDIINLINRLQKIAIIIGIVGIFAELFALGWEFGIKYLVTDPKRFGLYRVLSLTGYGSHNYLGIYMTLIFFLTAVMSKSSIKRATVFAMTLTTLVLTFSRQAWLGFGIMISLFKKKLIPIALLIVLAVIAMLLTDADVFNPEEYFRGYAFLQSLELLKSHPVFGVGPGMFGGVSASIFGSPYYADWPKYFQYLAVKIHGIDQFWPWIWSEGGLLGLLIYSTIWVSMYLYFRRISEFFLTKGDILLYNFGKVLRYFIFVIVVMGFAGGLNIAFVMFTYFGLGGMYVSLYRNENRDSI
jgi:hypothetical protein